MADNPISSTSLQIVGVGTAAGIGFTVALFITELALTDPVEQSNAKLAILVASALAATVAAVILRKGPPPPEECTDDSVGALNVEQRHGR